MSPNSQQQPEWGLEQQPERGAERCSETSSSPEDAEDFGAWAAPKGCGWLVDGVAETDDGAA